VVKNFKEDNNRMRWLTDEEEARLFADLPGRYHPLVSVALHTGLRKTEELSLEWSDVDFKLGQITVRKSKSGKGRVIPLNNEVAEVLRLVPRHINNPYVFTGKKEQGRMTDLPREWERYLEQAKIEDFHWHDLRQNAESRKMPSDASWVCKRLGYRRFTISTVGATRHCFRCSTGR
jgi:integrase